ncbi:Spc98 family-domain-containing protein [Endogone sp. FLAS-F59071]|nr:Spc98 family-domain-containing protein [Endogone sp. FLAS-F59071]|eukprot:RUS20820.1 Spc98 family-domain-containing protein [Endogone sp. FLAS-F59071]
MSRPRSQSTMNDSPPLSPSGRPGSAAQSRKGNLLLTQKEVYRITKTIATARQSTTAPFGSSLASEANLGESVAINGTAINTPGRGAANRSLLDGAILGHVEGSFYDERSYIRAPLNTRIHPPSTKGIDGRYVQIVRPNDDSDDEDIVVQETSPVPQYDDYMWDTVHFWTDQSLDPSLADLVDRILPVSLYYMSADAFVQLHSQFEYGLVSHALCAAIRGLLKEYLILIAQLEHQFRSSPTFALQKFWFYVQPTLQTMFVIHSLCNQIREAGVEIKDEDEEEDEIEAVLEGLKGGKQEGKQAPEMQKGGAVLTVVGERLVGMSGDPTTKKLHSYLLSQSSIPYLNILDAWIHNGEIRDPHNEFMVQEKKNVKKENLKMDFNDAYWEMRYTLRENAIPAFLEPLKSKILLAGKYLNVIRECGINIIGPALQVEAEAGKADGVDKGTGIGPAEVEQVVEERDKEKDKEKEKEKEKERDGVPNAIRDVVSGRGLVVHKEEKKSDLDGIIVRNDVLVAVDGGRFVRNLEMAYKYSNKTLLDLLLKSKQLIPRLRSLKHYFFLDQSDFLTPFLDVAEEELKKPSREVSMTRLQSLLDLVLRNPSSVAAYDPFKEDVKVQMSGLRLVDQLLRIINVNGLEGATINSLAASAAGKDAKWIGAATAGLKENLASIRGSIADYESPTGSVGPGSNERGGTKDVLTGYDALTLDYHVAFPLSLVISRKALTKYQLLFRHLLYLKHVESLLSDTWIDHKNPIWRRSSGIGELDRFKFRVFALRNRMLVFVQQFAYYVTSEVLEPNWRVLETNLTKVSTVDQVLQYHADFLDTCLKECMLTNAKLLRIYNKLMSTCVLFTSTTDRFTRMLSSVDSQINGTTSVRNGSVNSNSGSGSLSIEAQERVLHKLEENFLYHMKLLIDALNYYSAIETVQFLCLVVRLDYNTFYGKDKTNKDAKEKERDRDKARAKMGGSLRG